VKIVRLLSAVQDVNAGMLENAPMISRFLESNKMPDDLIDKIKSANPNSLGKVDVIDIELWDFRISNCYFSSRLVVSELTEDVGTSDDNPLILSYVDRTPRGLI